MTAANRMITKVCLLTLGSCCMVSVCAEPSPILIIDFGTSNTRMGVYRDEEFEIILNSQGHHNFPSCVQFTNDDGVLAGVHPLDAVSLDNVICGMKRLIGRLWDDPIVQDTIKHYPFQVVEGDNNMPIFKINLENAHRDVSIDELTTAHLKHMRETASRYLGQNVTRAVLTIPDHFTDVQREVIRHAAQLAGLEVLILLSEPIAAGLAYPLKETKNFNIDKTLLVIHQGTSSLDVFVMFQDYSDIFSVVASHTDPYLGGEVFDQRVMNVLLKTIQEATGGDEILLEGITRGKIQMKIEKAKLQLSSLEHVMLELRDLLNFSSNSNNISKSNSPINNHNGNSNLYSNGNSYNNSNSHNLIYNLSRSEFEVINMEIFRKMISVVSDVLQNADMRPDEIDDVIMVGGSTKIPKFQEMVKKFVFQQKELLMTIDPELAVVYGGLQRASDIDKYAEVEPFLDVTRLALGIQTHGGLFSPIINKFTIIPIPKKHQIFSTAADGQEAVNIQIYEGERLLCLNNKLLGQFDLPIVEQSARGIPLIMVTFEVDVNYFLTVSAQDLNSGHMVSVVIGKVAENLEDTKERIREAEKMAKEDKKTKELVETRLCLEQRAYTRMRRLKELGQVNEETGQDSEAGDCTGAFNLLEGPTDLHDRSNSEGLELLDNKQQEQILKDKEEL